MAMFRATPNSHRARRPTPLLRVSPRSAAQPDERHGQWIIKPDALGERAGVLARANRLRVTGRLPASR